MSLGNYHDEQSISQTPYQRHPVDIRELSKAASARLYAEYGLYLLPCYTIIPDHQNPEQLVCSCDSSQCTSQGKHPLRKFAGKGVDDATNDPTVIESIWQQSADANLAIATGKSGLIVLDFDNKPDSKTGEGLEYYLSMAVTYPEILDTPIARTGGGGIHLYYKLPPGYTGRPSVSKIAKYVDTRSGNSYVIAPPSNHISGAQYQFVKRHSILEKDIAELPQVWLEILLEKGIVQPVSADENEAPQQITPKHTLDLEIPPAVKASAEGTTKLAQTMVYHFLKVSQNGNRNPMFSQLSCQLRDLGLTIDQAIPYVEEYVEKINSRTSREPGYHPFTISEAMATLQSVYKRAPRAPPTDKGVCP